MWRAVHAPPPTCMITHPFASACLVVIAFFMMCVVLRVIDNTGLVLLWAGCYAFFAFLISLPGMPFFINHFFISIM
jgi:hypothetical protein